MIKNGLKIANINASEILKIKEGRYGEIKYNCVIPNSLLLDKLKDIGIKYNKVGTTKQIINVKFDYGYIPKEANNISDEYLKLKKENNKIKLINKDEIKSIKKLKKEIENAETQLIYLQKELEKENDEIKINNIKRKINNRNNKIKLNKKELLNKNTNIIDIIDKNDKKMKDLIKQYNDKIIKKEDLRTKLYNEGFSLDTYKTIKGKKVFDKTIEYVFWFRTAGKAKNGADYFIDKKLFNKINKWQCMGIKLPKINCKKVEMEVYKSLVSSAIEDYYICNPKTEILVVNDLDCYSDLQNVIRVYRDEETGFSKAEHTRRKCKNTIWDGMALIQTENGSTGFRGLRHHFYKTGAFIGDFQQYFKDYYGDKYNEATVIDRYGRELKLCKIKMITTENAMKWEKFFDDKLEGFNQWCEYVMENGCKFGICKRDHKSKYGSKQRMSYQMVNTLPLNNEDIECIFEDTKEYINKLQNDIDFLNKHLLRTKSLTNLNEFLLDVYNINNDFGNSFLYKENKKREINTYKESLKQGKILSEGDNETIVGNLFLLLKYVTGQLDLYIKNNVIEGYIDETLPNKNSCYCRRFDDGKTLGCFRSPHNSMHNIMVFENKKTDIMDKYFYCIGDNVIVVNFLYNDIQDRGNGLDTDTDFVYTTDNETIVKSCIKAQSYPTIVNDFKKSNKKYNDTMDDLAIIDNGLQASQKAIGTSSNVAQLYLSQYWDMLNNQNNNMDDKYENDYNYYFIEKVQEDNYIQQLLDNICILSVLAQVAVDSSKRSFEVGDLSPNALNKEIERLRKELPSKQKPTFWQYTSDMFKTKEIENKLKNKNKDYWNKLSEKEKKQMIKIEKNNMIENLFDYNCPVNNILKEIDKIGESKYGKRIKDIDFIEFNGSKNTKDRKQATKIENIIEEFNKATKFLNSIEYDEEEKDLYYNVLYEEYMDKLRGLSIKTETMALLISRVLSKGNNFLKNNSQIKTKLINMLYKYNKKSLLKCFKNS